MTGHWRTIPGFVRIGATGKTRGIQGELKLYVDDAFIQAALSAEFLFLQVNGTMVPLFVEEIREIQDVLVKFEGVDDPSQASYWSSLPVFLPNDEITLDTTVAPEELTTYSELKGFMLTDLSLGQIGTIQEVKEFPQQEMALVHYNNRDVLIPLNPHFIVEISYDQRMLRVDLPEGLLEL